MSPKVAAMPAKSPKKEAGDRVRKRLLAKRDELVQDLAKNRQVSDETSRRVGAGHGRPRDVRVHERVRVLALRERPQAPAPHRGSARAARRRDVRHVRPLLRRSSRRSASRRFPGRATAWTARSCRTRGCCRRPPVLALVFAREAPGSLRAARAAPRVGADDAPSPAPLPVRRRRLDRGRGRAARDGRIPGGLPRGRGLDVRGDGRRRAEAVADAATVALFSTNRLVVLEATELFRGKGLTAEDLDALLDEAAEARGTTRARSRASRAGRTRCAGGGRRRRRRRSRGRRAPDRRTREACRPLAGARRASRPPPRRPRRGRGDGARPAPRLRARARRASDNVLLVHAVTPDAQHARDAGPETRGARRGPLRARRIRRAASASPRSVSSARSTARCSSSPRSSSS